MKIVYLADYMDWVPFLARWHVAAWQPLYPGWCEEEAAAELRTHRMGCALPTTLLVLENGRCLGSVSLLQEDAREFAPLSPWLGNLYVTETARKRGIGRKLVLRAEEEARSLGIPVLYLFTEDREDFYTVLGWQRLRVDTLSGRVVVIMEKRL